MANSDKDILITPSVGGTAEPKIAFTGFDNNTVSLVVLDDGTLSIEGSAGQLFSISDSLAGTIFSVNDVSGIPSIEVDDDGTIRFAEFGGNVLIGTSTDDGTNKVQIVGGVDIDGALTATSLSGSLAFSNLTNLPDPTLTLNGDASGSATFTDLGNATLTVTVSDDSHNHIISNVDGLQTALDGKQATITGAATTITGSNLTASRALISNGSGKVAVSSTVTSTELGYLDGVTSAIQTQINGKQATITGAATTITGSNLTASRALISDGSGKVAVSSTVTSTELGYLDGVTSAIQTQINGKQATITGAATTITGSNLTASRALISDGSGKVAVSSTITSTELGYLDGVTSAIQTQLNGKQASGSYAVTTNNLSDLSNVATARTNLQLGALATLGSVNAATITDNSVGAAELNVSGNGTTTQFLRSDGDGTFTWATPPDTTTNNFVNSVTFNGSGTLTLGRSGLGDLSDTLASGDITGPLGYTPYQEGTALTYSSATSNITTNHNDYLVFPNGAGLRRMTNQGGLALGCDSSLVLHAGDNRTKYFEFFAINSTVTAETAYLTADGEVKLVSNMQSGVAANAKTATLTAAGNFTVPGSVTSGGNTVLTTATSFGGDVSGTYNAIVIDDNSHNHTIDNITNLTTTLGGKQDTITGAATTIVSSDLTANRAVISNGSGKIATSSVTSTELGYVSGVTSAIQTQLNGKLGSTAKAADSELLDGINSTSFIRLNTGSSDAAANRFGDSALIFGNAGTTSGDPAVFNNVDHIHYNESTNTFHFVADTNYKADGNATVRAGTFNEGGTDLASKYLGLTAKAADSNKLDNLDSTQFVRSDADDTITGDITLSNAALSYTGGSGATSHIHVLRPQGGAYATTTSAITGAIKITLPVLWTNTMMRFHVDFYDYASGTVESGSSQGESWSMELGGYNYIDSTAWINCFAYLKSGDSTKFFPVRFGNDGTKACIYIGEVTSTWSYPQILVRDFFGAFGGDTAANWADGWDVDFVTTGLNGVLVNSSLAARVPKGNFDVGTATSEAQIRITKPDDDVSDHLQFFSGTTRIGEIGAQDTSWLRINQVTNKNIYTPRYIRADGGLFVDDTSHGINSSGNLLNASLTGTYSNALTFSNASNAFTGDGSGLTSLTGANVSGTVATAAVANKPQFADDSVDVAALTSRVASGFYETSSATTAEGWPVGNNSYNSVFALTHLNNSNYYSMQIGGSFFDQDFYGRKTNNSGSQSWVKFLTSGNYNSYSPTLTGTGASGSWGISITGNAATATSATSATNSTNFNVAADNTTNATHYVTFTGGATGNQRPNSDSELTYNPSTNIMNVVVGTRGDLSAETGRTVHETGIYTFNTNNASLGNSTPASTYWSTLGWGQGTGGMAQLAASWTNNGNELWFRSLRDTTDDWWAWKEILHSSNYTSYITASYINGLTIDADTLGGQAGSYYLALGNATGTLAPTKLAQRPTSGDWFSGGPPIVGTDGVMEIGRYIDFHQSDATTNDFDVRLDATGSNQLTINGAGRILTTGDEGSGNGLDADTVDGQEGSYYLNYNNFTNTPTIPTNNNQLTNGAGYLTASSTQSKYLRSDVADTAAGLITFSGGINGFDINNGISGNNFNISGVNQLSINDPGEGIVFGGGATSVTLAAIDDATDSIMNFTNASELRVNNSAVFTVGNHISQLSNTLRKTGFGEHSATNLAVGWYTIAVCPTARAIGKFALRETTGGRHHSVLFYATHMYGTNVSNTITVLQNAKFSTRMFGKLRIKDAATYDGAALQVYIENATNAPRVYDFGEEFAGGSDWILKDWVPDATDPGDVGLNSSSTNGASVSEYPNLTSVNEVDLSLTDNGGAHFSGNMIVEGQVLGKSDSGGVIVRTDTNGQVAKITMSDAVTGGFDQKGEIRFMHANGAANALGGAGAGYGSGFEITTNGTANPLIFKTVGDIVASGKVYANGNEELISGNVTGTLFADVIAANQINADMIAANQITASLIAANQITANELQISTEGSGAGIFMDGANARIVISDS